MDANLSIALRFLSKRVSKKKKPACGDRYRILNFGESARLRSLVRFEALGLIPAEY